MARSGMNDERPYWQRHYGIGGGPIDKRAGMRLVLAFFVAIALVLLVIVVGALVTS
jgi:uncharacterized membrane protein